MNRLTQRFQDGFEHLTATRPARIAMNVTGGLLWAGGAYLNNTGHQAAGVPIEAIGFLEVAASFASHRRQERQEREELLRDLDHPLSEADELSGELTQAIFQTPVDIGRIASLAALGRERAESSESEHDRERYRVLGETAGRIQDEYVSSPDFYDGIVNPAERFSILMHGIGDWVQVLDDRPRPPQTGQQG